MELLAKAQAFLNNKHFSDQEIAKKIGVGRMMINNYRNDKTKLTAAKYSIVKLLADEYDKNAKQLNSADFKHFVNRIENLFKEVQCDQEDSYNSDDAYLDDLALIPVLERVSKEVISDPALMNELYEIYSKNLN
ncbi:hypothetical protein [Companilactobacillus kimchiensis]|uniref:Uncharacterized protein n=1 Tax=Companilactobacillus kimchiensis TaxID=993692 RepID=A0A0R2LI46_9LACO|nr:hypothetical protein [Companilactobacillus kimchiensis]KRN98349.1 hypothetical protein IV57_GL001178 [Companilactobacillus kimchiensis]